MFWKSLDLKFTCLKNCLYDTVPVLYYTISKQGQGSLSAMHGFNDPSIPVHSSFTVRIKPTEELPAKWNDKVVLQREYGGKRNIQKSQIRKWMAGSGF